MGVFHIVCCFEKYFTSLSYMPNNTHFNNLIHSTAKAQFGISLSRLSPKDTVVFMNLSMCVQLNIRVIFNDIASIVISMLCSLSTAEADGVVRLP